MDNPDSNVPANGQGEDGKKRRFRNVLTYIGPLFGLIGISLALYFHSQSVQERVPSYYISPLRATIVDVTGATPSELQVLHRGNPVPSKNVVAAVIYFWNDGRMPIRASDVLEPLVVELGKPSEILEARMLRISRPVTKLSLGDAPSGSRNQLPLSFDILEKSDGAAIQIIYAGDSHTPINVKGTIVGAGVPRLLANAEKVYKTESKTESLRKLQQLFYYVIGALILLVLSLATFLRLKTKVPIKEMLPMFGGLLLMLATVIFSLYWVHTVLSPGVPASIWLEK